MFRYPTWAVGSNSSCPTAIGTKSTGGFYHSDGSPCITSDIFFQPEFRDAFDSAPDSSEDSLKADIERLMSQAKYEAVLIAERNLARSDIFIHLPFPDFI